MNDPINMKDPSGFRPIYTTGEETYEMIEASYEAMAKISSNKGKSNSHEVKYKDGKVHQERWYGQDGKAIKDRHHTDHENAKKHPKVSHDHDRGYNDFWRLIMRGISFILNKSEHSILASILDGIDITSLYWSVSEDEIYVDEGENLYIEKNIDGMTFLNIINTDYYFVYFANIKAYTDNNYSDNINCYDDFLNSNCELVILCSDGIYYEIYSKSEEVIRIIKSNCIKKGFDEIGYITDENDCRTIFSVE